MSQFHIRPATAADLPAVHSIWYNDAIASDPQPPEQGPVLSGFTYELEHGVLRVAEDESGQVIGFGATVSWDGPHGPLTYLADLFIKPDAQSHGIGQALLRALPLEAGGRCVHASVDPRAATLYIRTGMLPRWANLRLVADPTWGAHGLATLPGGDVEVIEASEDDPDLVAWDLRGFGYARLNDIPWLMKSRDAQPLWFQRAGKRIGYGFVQRNCGESLRRPNAWGVGPIGAETPEDARDCVCAATNWTVERTGAARLGVPGPHPALAPLIAAGCRIVYNELFLASPDARIFDTERYLPSGYFL
ncbi:MAG TPA: GNAT family N-acetyltransferase [Ktedonobacterales bacterium]|nr:GNAT family N-acetyltransferase [Ktedonobacterales bacterium]